MNQGSVGGGRGKGGGATRDALTNSSYFTEIALLDIVFLFDASYMAYFIFTCRFNMLTVIMCRIVLLIIVLWSVSEVGNDRWQRTLHLFVFSL